MPITSTINSKANVKQATSQDLPFSQAYPVLTDYQAVSTASQTVINLPFSIQATGSLANTGSFDLFVDGKKLSLGSSNDYTFTSIGTDGTSSQVTLNQSLAVNLNIYARKLGLKPEILFQMDNRFTQVYAAQSAGFQGFVSQTDFLMTATSTAGTPAAGNFYSSIVGRAAMVDLSQDLKPRMGVERIMIQTAQQIQNEFGPNGEPIFGTPNDTFGQIRLAGLITNTDDTNGQRPVSNATTDFVEITFYGTGLNMLLPGTGVTSLSYSVDGGSSASFFTTTVSTVLSSRNYSLNQPVPVVAGLTLGVHTVKITSSNTGQGYAGFEILNESSSVKVSSGIGYIQGQKYTSAALQSFSYSAPVSGTRGGRVAVYQKSDGTIGEAFQATNSAQANLTSADHTNEEVARTWQFREFGAGRSDDFSTSGSSVTRAFTLDDDSTTIVATGIDISTVANPSGRDGLRIGGTTQFVTFTFVGTGLDIDRQDTTAGGADTFSVTIDGTNVGNLNSTGSTTRRRERIVSGLPYGTHTVKILSVSQVTFAVYIYGYTAYQPKTPAIPSGTIQIGSYNVMANFTANATQGGLNLATGVLRKISTREMVYSGTWSVSSVDASATGGFIVSGNTASNFMQYTFFGTGFDLRLAGNTSAATFTLSVDGAVNNSGFTSGAYGSAMSYNSTTGVITSAVGTGLDGCGVYISGLTLGVHTIKVTWTSGTGNMNVEAIDVITPIHSYKSNLYSDIQNTLSVGSNAIQDDRKTTPVKEILPATKAWEQALGITANPTTTSTSLIPMPDMSCTIKTTGGALQISYSSEASNSGGNFVSTQIVVDGIFIGSYKQSQSPSGGQRWTTSDSIIVPVAPGVHKVDLYWCGDSGTVTAYVTQRNLNVKEL